MSARSILGDRAFLPLRAIGMRTCRCCGRLYKDTSAVQNTCYGCRRMTNWLRAVVMHDVARQSSVPGNATGRRRTT